jgi:hypothetical protein
MQSSLMEDHNTFGWYLYIPFMFLLFMWGNKLATCDALNDKPITGFTNNLPNKLNILIAIFIFVIFSTSGKSILFNEKKQVNQAKNITTITPEVFHASSVKVSDSFLGNHSKLLTYSFDGTDLDAKPTYFNNQLIPKGLQQKDQYSLNHWNINIVSTQRKSALVLFQYEIDNEKVPTSREFKIKRLIKGLRGIKDTKLHWIYVECKTNCNKELNALENLK